MISTDSSVTSQLPIKVDVLIVGGGMAGLSTAYYLSQYAHLKTVLLEAKRIGHSHCSSSGEERMYRRMYSSEYLSYLQEKSLQEWRSIEVKHNCQLLRSNGLLFYGDVWGEETIEGSILGAKRVMEQKNIPFEEVDATAMATRWAMKPHKDFIGLYEMSAGMVWAHKALQLFYQEALAQGVTFYQEEAVDRIIVSSPNQIIVKSTKGRLFAPNKIVLAASAWTNELLAHFQQNLELEIWSMLWGYYQVEKGEIEHFPQWFCFQKANPNTGDGGLYYGFPCHDLDSGLIKVGIDWCPPKYRTRTMADFRREPDPKLAQFLDRFLRKNWRGIDKCVSLQCCPYTMTKDTLFVLDRLPQFPQVTIFTGGSGQAFKFAPILGKLLSELVLEQELSVDITPFNIQRVQLN
ncbi:MAG: FAD-dependent oxidoreductase [Prochloraceae cyanobacterium]|nr:FAD-dependent oxidoreductase [Prochloraceae cyanobacterium]